MDDRIDEVRSCECCGGPVILTPRIMCSHCNKQLPIKCYIYRKHGMFYGSASP